jgi:hypothetical protein
MVVHEAICKDDKAALLPPELVYGGFDVGIVADRSDDPGLPPTSARQLQMNPGNISHKERRWD